ncbi:MAG: YeeE/YedE thiosulfate transporter family protein [Acidimicrobiales bacterium]
MPATTRRILTGNIVFGLLLGFTVANIGFGDFGELNRMFTFQDLRMFGAFAGGVALAAAAFALLRSPRPARTPVHRGIVPGAILFGTGWAISGGCPAIPIIQAASGMVPALATIAGVVVGMVACRWANSRWFGLDRGSCGL